jgi:hypothetical protein
MNKVSKDYYYSSRELIWEVLGFLELRLFYLLHT